MLDGRRVSKALTLKMLEKHQKGIVVDPFFIFTVREWRQCSHKIIARIQRKNLGLLVIVRSAALTEDSRDSMPPGTYHTELNVPVSSAEMSRRRLERSSVISA